MAIGARTFFCAYLNRFFLNGRVAREAAAIVFVTAIFMLAVPGIAYASNGVHIVILKKQSDASWQGWEFIDFAMIQPEPGNSTSENCTLYPGMQTPLTGHATVTLVSSQIQPLIIFSSQHAEHFEERISLAEQQREKDLLQTDITRELIGGLFQIPAWPYLAASEVPVANIDIERSWRVGELREFYFPAATYAGTGEVRRWDILEQSPSGVILSPSAGSGVGMGVVLEYIITGDLSFLQIYVSEKPRVSALYVQDSHAWVPSGALYDEISTTRLLGALDEESTVTHDKIQYSPVGVNDTEGVFGRYLLAPFRYEGRDRIAWVSATDEILPINNISDKLPPALLIVLACWLIFGIVMMAGNLIFPFYDRGFMQVLSTSILVYPMLLLLSMLLSGYWGLGFVPAAAGISRFLAPEGRRTRAFGVILASSFAVLFISWIIIR